MFCYQCGMELTNEDFCTNCGAEVWLYKKICATSNLYYNQGLEKAQVRDLSGAKESLRLSLKYNKRNTDARNLLGLVYFETGEAALAIREWVLSSSFYQGLPGKNLADAYLSEYQGEGRLENAGKATRKYNLALGYCYSDAYDLAQIQLKRLLSSYPKFLKARQLLALLYIREENWSKARKELEKCLQLDNGSALTQKLYQETLRMTGAEEENAAGADRYAGSYRYMEDNETIIEPRLTGRGLGLLGGVAYAVLGILLGVAFSWFLVMPSRLAKERASFEEKTREVAEQIDAKNANAQELEQQITALEREKNLLEEELEAYSGGMTSAQDELLLAAKAYIDNPENLEEVGERLANADAFLDGTAGEAYQSLYSTLLASVGPSLALEAYSEGSRLYQASNYADAIPYFERAVKMDNANPQAYLMLGNAYRRNNDTENAIRVYEQLIDRLPDSDEALRAADSLGELQGA
ncbi:MAG: tetratricopeptide repeat protein [Lachnospiraceae bacterium]|nr:tetratricopeptide repeat protein [Lachnospiraceae bacterium]